MTDQTNLTVTHQPERNSFEIVVNAHVAVLNYTLQGNTIIFTHTGVPHELEGQGIGSRLVKVGLEYARDHQLKVVPLCWFVAKYIQRHSEYQDLLVGQA